MDNSSELSVQDVIKLRSLINLPHSGAEQNKRVPADEAHNSPAINSLIQQKNISSHVVVWKDLAPASNHTNRQVNPSQ